MPCEEGLCATAAGIRGVRTHPRCLPRVARCGEVHSYSGGASVSPAAREVAQSTYPWQHRI
eukprot:7743250-Alexandrium_andersonii.AAC.1